MIHNADPSNSDAFRSRGQPEILNGATGAVQVCLSHRGTAQDMSASTLTSAGHAEIDRRFLDPFEFQALIQRRTGAVVTHGSFSIRLREELFDGSFRRALTNDDKVPRLHIPDRSGMMRCGQDPRKHSSGNRLSHKIPSDIPPFENHPVDRCPFIVRKPSSACIPDTWTHTHIAHSML